MIVSVEVVSEGASLGGKTSPGDGGGNGGTIGVGVGDGVLATILENVGRISLSKIGAARDPAQSAPRMMDGLMVLIVRVHETGIGELKIEEIWPQIIEAVFWLFCALWVLIRSTLPSLHSCL